LQRLKDGLLEEFPSSANSTLMQLPSSQAPPVLSFVGVGEGAVPRGCKWTACAGVVLQLPDHSAIAAAAGSQPYSQQVQASQEKIDENDVVVVVDQQNTAEQQQQQQQGATLGWAPTTPAYLFKSHAVQFADNVNYIDALKRVNWSGHGFKALNIGIGSSGNSSTPPAEREHPSVEPVAVVLRCEQPESMATIAAIVVHLYCPITATIEALHSSQEGSVSQPKQKSDGCSAAAPPKLAPLHQRTLIRSAIDAALADLKHQCPSVISDRRDRSLMKALPVVSTAVAGILGRAVGTMVLVEACQALRVREVGELADKLHRKLEEVVICSQQQQQRVGEESARGA
jgi:hypothetical protein